MKIDCFSGGKKDFMQRITFAASSFFVNRILTRAILYMLQSIAQVPYFDFLLLFPFEQII